MMHGDRFLSQNPTRPSCTADDEQRCQAARGWQRLGGGAGRRAACSRPRSTGGMPLNLVVSSGSGILRVVMTGHRVRCRPELVILRSRPPAAHQHLVAARARAALPLCSEAHPIDASRAVRASTCPTWRSCPPLRTRTVACPRSAGSTGALRRTVVRRLAGPGARQAIRAGPPHAHLTGLTC